MALYRTVDMKCQCPHRVSISNSMMKKKVYQLGLRLGVSQSHSFRPFAPASHLPAHTKGRPISSWDAPLPAAEYLPEILYCRQWSMFENRWEIEICQNRSISYGLISRRERARWLKVISKPHLTQRKKRLQIPTLTKIRSICFQRKTTYRHEKLGSLQLKNKTPLRTRFWFRI